MVVAILQPAYFITQNKTFSKEEEIIISPKKVNGNSIIGGTLIKFDFNHKAEVIKLSDNTRKHFSGTFVIKKTQTDDLAKELNHKFKKGEWR